MRHNAKHLTVAAIEKFTPRKNGRREIKDHARGLLLIIQPRPSGARSWAFRARGPSGAPRMMTIGSVDLSGRKPRPDPRLGDALTIEEARVLAGNLWRAKGEGRDVVEDARAERRRLRAEAEAERRAITYPQAAARFVIERAFPETRRWHEAMHVLGLRLPDETPPAAVDDFEAAPGGLAIRWRDRLLAGIDKSDVQSVVDEAYRRAIPGMRPKQDTFSNARKRLLGRTLSAFFDWCHEHALVAANPCIEVRLPGTPDARERVLRADEIRAVWNACSDSDPYGRAVKLLLLTGCRRDEVGELRWEEVNLADRRIDLPAARTKQKREHVVPLTDAAMALLGDRADGYVFSTTGGERPISGWSKFKRKLDEASSVSGWRLHDLRRTAVTGMNDIGVLPHVVEAVVGHGSGFRGGVAGTYNKAKYLSERRVALQRWADHVTAIVEGREPASNVVPLAPAG